MIRFSTLLLPPALVLMLAFDIGSDTMHATIGKPATLKVPQVHARGLSHKNRRIKVNIPISYKKCPAGDESPPTASAEFEAEVLQLVNKERRAQGLSPLSMDMDLTRSARYHANDMAIEDYFSHPSQDRENGRLIPACETFRRIGAFSNSPSGENIAAGQQTPASVMDSWMKSPGHRQNILSGARTLGVGVARGKSRFGIYWVQNFGR